MVEYWIALIPIIGIAMAVTLLLRVWPRKLKKIAPAMQGKKSSKIDAIYKRVTRRGQTPSSMMTAGVLPDVSQKLSPADEVWANEVAAKYERGDYHCKGCGVVLGIEASTGERVPHKPGCKAQDPEHEDALTLDVNRLQETICRSMCANVLVHASSDGRFLVETPFTLSDGDCVSIFLEPLPSHWMRITDLGNTLMHLSYTEDIERLNEDTRAKLLERIVAEIGLTNRLGEFLIDSAMDDLGPNLLRFGQALILIHCIGKK